MFCEMRGSEWEGEGGSKWKYVVSYYEAGKRA